MDFKLQQTYSCEVVGKARCLYRKNEERQKLQLQYNSELLS